MRRLLFAVLLAAPALGQTTDNNASCDIAVTPAATLLLPYFEVDTTAPGGATMIFTITNASRFPQIAKVTIWTDWAYPVLSFNLFLTGYDVQPVNLYDVLVVGTIPQTAITTPPGGLSLPNMSNPNFVRSGPLDVSTTCANLPSVLPPDVATAVRTAITIGVRFTNCPWPVGGNHPGRAIGYATIDVVSTCSNAMPTDAGGAYFAGPSAPLLFDNVLFGEYVQLAPENITPAAASSLDAQSAPMVHIRAVPAGGQSGANGGVPIPTNLPFTFYDRYTPAGVRTADRRQPLPSTFAARYIQGGFRLFGTNFKIWREGVTAGLPSCTPNGSVLQNSVLAVTSIIRFDEHENATTLVPTLFPHFVPTDPPLPATSRTESSSFNFPALSNSGDLGGWMYLNLSTQAQYIAASGRRCASELSAQRAGFTGPCAMAPPGSSGSRATTQNWVIVSMFGGRGANRMAVDFPAAMLANGCTLAEQKGAPISPALVCPPETPSWNCAPGAQPPRVNP